MKGVKNFIILCSAVTALYHSDYIHDYASRNAHDQRSKPPARIRYEGSVLSLDKTSRVKPMI